MTVHEKMKGYSLVTASMATMSLLGYFATPYPSYFLGFFVGLFFGFLNLWTTYQKALVIGKFRPTTSTKRSFLSYGLAGVSTVIRIAFALAAVALALYFPEAIHLFSVIAGFSLIYVIILLDLILQTVRKR
ncbi:ATP synthase subunit I [Halalkalibacterium halodurans]|jgi:ATP synthase protein I|uniref:ATP synthase protein n=1 Tax=Halalkalibacterium halodurans (strain ATCC BAA-125 / DSM 18197 / FERM 7344 / JCM 9153 / C-125) TaxID=272558 RepID=Q9K6G8_HALH5|nr:ATP synthase subunit I [Halalkalibacterium halodurans]MDY7224266.1 ATP synthase subunit I [Halalkalibacterium halodurans]MDY7243551.1 ATP synthase subunit I [Halalkalibacterium halodurans]MED4171894.1 ATP synthase subunit I [Halalkalibacterium halodurans]BAB07480.1 ATP synthase protein [Halalkalibacterium halodurans C-125]